MIGGSGDSLGAVTLQECHLCAMSIAIPGQYLDVLNGNLEGTPDRLLLYRFRRNGNIGFQILQTTK